MFLHEKKARVRYTQNTIDAWHLVLLFSVRSIWSNFRLFKIDFWLFHFTSWVIYTNSLPMQTKQKHNSDQVNNVTFLCCNWLKFSLNIPIWLTQFRFQTRYLHTGLGYISFAQNQDLKLFSSKTMLAYCHGKKLLARQFILAWELSHQPHVP